VTMSTLSPKGQALIRAGARAYQPTDADRERLLGALRAQLGPSAPPPDMSLVATAASASRTLWWLISAVAVGIGIVGGAVLLARGQAPEPASPHKAAVTSVVATTPAVEPVAAPPAEGPTSTATTVPEPDLPAPSASPANRPKDSLSAEVAILSRATRDLRAGHPADALKALDEYRRKFPKGLLGEEYRAARAQALCALGRFDEANAKLAELPSQSPLAMRARQFCDARWAAR
jgi:hypothetical protein